MLPGVKRLLRPVIQPVQSYYVDNYKTDLGQSFLPSTQELFCFTAENSRDKNYWDRQNASNSQNVSNNQRYNELVPVTEVPYRYRCIFDKYPFFNIVQSTVFNDIFYKDCSMVVSAPTGSGKTVIMELAIVHLLLSIELHRGDDRQRQPRIVYMAPLKSLVGEKYEDWRVKLLPLGLTCAEVTGDTDYDDFDTFKNSQVIMTTPEKWDALTRRWRDHSSVMNSITLLLIDEVHILNDEHRGPTLEVVVSRMKTIKATRGGTSNGLRIIAVSATVPNAEDVAQWLSDAKNSAVHYKLKDNLRPVQLRQVVLGYPCSDSWSEFRFDISLSYKLSSVIVSYNDNKPSLVFVSTRKGAQQTASVLAKETRFIKGSGHRELLIRIANGLKDNKLRAMGVNLPAHLVVIKSTSQYLNHGYEEYSAAQLLQMVGRAGRPQFDDHATAVIMTKAKHKEKYQNLLIGNDLLESHLHQHLIEHLNAEVVLRTISDIAVAVEWLRSTFFYVRVQKNPGLYGLPSGLDADRLEVKLQEMCLREMNALASEGLIIMDEMDIKPTTAGKLMARYCVSFATMKKFLKLTGDESLKELIELVSTFKEFEDVKIRMSEKKFLNELNSNKVTPIRFPIKGRIKMTEQKVNCLIQATFGCLAISDPGLSQDAAKIFRFGQRIAKCLMEYQLSQRKNGELLLNSVLIAKCFRSRLWENSKLVARQLQRIGPALATTLANAKLTSFAAIEDADTSFIEMEKDPIQSAYSLPKLSLEKKYIKILCAVVSRHLDSAFVSRFSVCHAMNSHLNRQPKQSGHSEHSRCAYIVAGLKVQENNCEVIVIVQMLNFEDISSVSSSTAGLWHSMMLIVSDASNKVLYTQRIMDSSLFREGKVSRQVTMTRSGDNPMLLVHLVSEGWVGLDLQTTYTPRYLSSSCVNYILEDENDQTVPDVMSNSIINCSQKVLTQKGRRECLHTCSDKLRCAHACCKTGVAEKKRKECTSLSVFKDPKIKKGNPKEEIKTVFGNSKICTLSPYFNSQAVTDLQVPVFDILPDDEFFEDSGGRFEEVLKIQEANIEKVTPSLGSSLPIESKAALTNLKSQALSSSVRIGALTPVTPTKTSTTKITQWFPPTPKSSHRSGQKIRPLSIDTNLKPRSLFNLEKEEFKFKDVTNDGKPIADIRPIVNTKDSIQAYPLCYTSPGVPQQSLFNKRLTLSHTPISSSSASTNILQHLTDEWKESLPGQKLIPQASTDWKDMSLLEHLEGDCNTSETLNESQGMDTSDDWDDLSNFLKRQKQERDYLNRLYRDQPYEKSLDISEGARIPFPKNVKFYSTLPSPKCANSNVNTQKETSGNSSIKVIHPTYMNTTAIAKVSSRESQQTHSSTFDIFEGIL